MSAEDNKALVRRWVEECYNPGNLALLDELFASDFVNHDPVRPDVRDLDGLKRLLSEQREALPDLLTTIEDLVADGDKVVKRFIFQGTQTGEILGIPPTGKRVTMTGMDMLRIADGKIAEIWWSYDALGLMQQLGLMPSP